MEKKIIQTGLVLVLAALLANQLFAQANKQQDSTTVTSIAFPFHPQTTHTVHDLTRDDLRHSPIRNLSDWLALQNGIIRQDGALHVRGGRAGQIVYFIDGANATNAFLNDANLTFIPEAVQEIQVHTGAYSAEYGGANSALVQTVLRTGGSKFEATVDYHTDNFAKPGKQFLGTSSFGLHNVVMTLGGPMPLIPRLRFFLAGQHQYLRNRDILFLEPFRFDSLKTDVYDIRPGRPLPGPVIFERNNLPGNWYRNHSIQGTLVYETKPLALRFTGLYTEAQNPLDTNWPNALENFFRRRGREQDRTALASLKATHHFSPSISYELGVSYASHSNRKFDPNFGDNWKLYSDSLANAKIGYTGFLRRYRGPLPYSVISGFNFLAENQPLTTYSRDEQSRIGASFDFTAQIAKYWKLKVGGHFDKWTIRFYAVGDIPVALEYLYGFFGSNPPVFPSALVRRALILQRGQIDNYGYNLEGESVETGVDAPHHPNFGSLFLQNKFSFHKLVANLGLRYERIALQVPRPRNLLMPPFDPAGSGLIDDSDFIKTAPNGHLLPRVGLSFMALRQTELFAAYGKYAQVPALRDVYRSPRLFAAAFHPAGYNTLGFIARPERLTQYEFGARQIVANTLSFSATYFYKDFPDLLRPGSIFHASGRFQGFYLYGALLNRDQTRVKGLELTLTTLHVKRWSAQVNYTFSQATGTEADPLILYHFGLDYIPKIYKLDYNRTHDLAIIADFRLGKNEGGKFLSGLGLNAILNYTSGHPFTSIFAPQSLGTSSPWMVGVDALANPQNFFPKSEINGFNIPSSTNIDLSVSKLFSFPSWTAEFYIEALNLFNNKATINVYPQTGSTTNGWLDGSIGSYFAQNYRNFASFYKAINDNNHWNYSQATGKDLFSTPRQVRLGLRLGL